MAKLTKLTHPLADVNVLKQSDGSVKIVACFSPDPDLLVGEGESRVVLALDASRSLKEMFGFGGAFGGTPNYVELVGRKLGEILSGVSRHGEVAVVYWAIGPSGGDMEELGRFSTADVATAKINGPKTKKWGGGTQMLPAIKYICDVVAKGSDWTMGVVVTDGIIEDEDACMKYCMKVGQELASDKRGDLKLVLIGVGAEVDKGQLERFDDMFEGTKLEDDIDIWSHGIAASMQDESEITDVLFGELMSEVEVAPSGRALDANGQEVATWTDGLPGKVTFFLPKGNASFTIKTPGGDVTQDISEAL